MEQGYNILFTVSLLLDGVASSYFTIAPTMECNSVMQSHGMVFKSRPNQSFTAAEYLINDQNIAGNIRPLQQTEKFSFLVILNDNRFLQKADFQNTGDTERVGRKIYYFNNLGTSNVIDGNLSGDTVVLSGNALVSSEDLCSVIPASIQFPVDSSKYSEVQLFQMLPSQPDKQLPSVYTPAMPQAIFLLGKNPAGAYKLNWIGAPPRSEIIYADNNLVTGNFFALIEIFKDTQANNDILNNNMIHYTIPFKAV